MTLERILTIILFLATIIAGVVFLKQKNINYRLVEYENRGKPYVKMEEVFKEPLTLWWGGISGSYPRFIDAKGMKGLGWEEFPAYKIKNELRDKYGVTIVDWMVNPSRLEHEFHLNRRPVCIFPYKWSHPEKEFKGPRTHLLSHGLDFGGEANFGILIRKDEMKRFVNHFGDKGDLKLDSVIADKSLTTAIIKGENYDATIAKTYSVTKEGDWQIKKDYTKNIYMMVASDNSQLLSMLNGKRIDYVLDHLVTKSHYRAANIAEDTFKRLIYRQVRLESFDDPNLIRYSIRCNLHPLNFELIPIFNKLIKPMTYGAHEKIQWDKHRRKFEPVYRGDSTPIQTKLLKSEGQDNWFTKYGMDKDLGEGLKEIKQPSEDKDEQSQMNFQTKIVRREIVYKVFQDVNRLFIVDSGFVSGLLGMQVSGVTDLREQFEEDTLAFLKATPPKDLNQKQLFKLNFNNVQYLFMVTPSLPPKSMEKIINQTSNLKGLHIHFPPRGLEANIYNHLTPSIEELTLAAFTFLKNPIGKWLKKNKLTKINLMESVMLPSDLRTLLSDHNGTLKQIVIGRGINEKVSRVFKEKKWPDLEELILPAIGPNNRRLDWIVSSLGAKLKRFSGPGLFPHHFKHLEKNCPNLQDLSVTGSYIPQNHVLPPLLEQLTITVFDTKNSNLQGVVLPRNLKQLNLSANFRNGDLKYLNKFLGSSLEVLSLKGTVETSELREFLKDTQISNLKTLILDQLRVDDQMVKIIAEKFPNLEALNIANNLISDGAGDYFGLFKNLQILDISANLMTDEGIIKILSHPRIQNGLKVFYINNPLRLNPRKIAKSIPKKLEVFSLNGMKLGDDSAFAILQVLPDSLRELAWSASLVQPQSIAKFISLIPPRLESLGYVYVKDGIATTEQLINAFPNTLLSLKMTGQIKDKFSKNTFLPPGLINASFGLVADGNTPEYMEIVKNAVKIIVDSFPRGVLTGSLYFGEFPIDSSTKKQLEGFTNLGMFSVIDKSILPKVSFFVNVEETTDRFFRALNSNLGAAHLEGFRGDMDAPGQFTRPKFIEDSNFVYLLMIGPKVSDEFMSHLTKANLSNLLIIKLQNSSLTVEGILSLLKAISPDAVEISLAGSRLKLENVDKVIEALPPRLHSLNISGSSFGQKGYQKFRDWADAQEKKHGFRLELIE